MWRTWKVATFPCSEVPIRNHLISNPAHHWLIKLLSYTNNFGICKSSIVSRRKRKEGRDRSPFRWKREISRKWKWYCISFYSVEKSWFSFREFSKAQCVIYDVSNHDKWDWWLTQGNVGTVWCGNWEPNLNAGYCCWQWHHQTNKKLVQCNFRVELGIGYNSTYLVSLPWKLFAENETAERFQTKFGYKTAWKLWHWHLPPPEGHLRQGSLPRSIHVRHAIPSPMTESAYFGFRCLGNRLRHGNPTGIFVL